MSRLTRDGTAEPVSRDQILRHARGQGNIHFPCSADHEQDWQPYSVDPYSAICDDHTCIKHNRILKAAGRARFAFSGRLMPCVAHLMLVMLRLTPFVAHLMLVMVLNMTEQCSFQDLLFHLLFMPKYAEKSASRMGISLSVSSPSTTSIPIFEQGLFRGPGE